MHLSLIALAVLTTGGSAALLKPLSNRAGICNMNTCVAALAPSFPRRAIPQSRRPEPVRADTPFNAACFAAAARSTAAFPPACTQCAAQFGATDPANNAQGGNADLPNAGSPAAVGPRAQFGVPDPTNNAQGNGNRPNANGAPPNGANPVATNNQFPGPGSPAAVVPRPQFGVPDPANNAQGNGNRPNANGAPARGANPVATNNQAPAAGSPAAGRQAARASTGFGDFFKI
ncbi:hypothetical protein C8J57DRAFT_1519497 [Mycena rebaudengoi]|nr:hypothetical protein C8J57DRAFT_1519497 [Mycena rebaudengoi]